VSPRNADQEQFLNIFPADIDHFGIREPFLPADREIRGNIIQTGCAPRVRRIALGPLLEPVDPESPSLACDLAREGSEIAQPGRSNGKIYQGARQTSSIIARSPAIC